MAIPQDIKLKLKLIYLPSIISLILSVTLLGLFRWTFDFQLSILPLKEEVWTFIIPICLSILIMLFWLRKRFFILNLTTQDGESYQDLFQFLVVLLIGLSISVSQTFLQKASFSLNKISEVQEIKKHPREKYFRLKRLIADYVHKGIYVTSSVSDNDENKTLDYSIFVVCPIFEFEHNALVIPDSNAMFWYAKKFTKSVDYDLNQDQKSKAFRQFSDNVLNVFDKTSLQTPSYFRKIGYSYQRDHFIKAIQQRYPQINSQKQIILSPEQGKFSNRYTHALWDFLGMLGISLVGLSCMAFIPKIAPQALENYQQRKPRESDELKEIFALLNPIGDFKAVSIIFWVNVLVYIGLFLLGVNFFAPTAQELLQYGGVSKPTILKGQYWRLITANFIHSGLLHLLSNMCILGLVGFTLRYYLKTYQLLLLYFLCGIGACLNSIYWHENIVSVGASGAIFGLTGVLLSLHLTYKPPSKGVNAPSPWFALIPLGISLLLGFGAAGIDNAGHVGGLITGLLLGMLMSLFKWVSVTSDEKS